MELSQRLQSMPISAVRKLVPFAQQAKEKGAHIYHLNIGDPDIKTPEAMLKILTNWTANPIRYAPSQGLESFLEALVWYYRKLGHSFVEASDIITTVGGSEAISMALFGVTNPGDEVLVFEPFYSNYASLAALTDVRFVAVPTTLETGFHLPDKKTIESYITPRTRAVLFCTPGNPTGTVYTKQEMDLLVEIATERNLYLISDEVYREYIFSGAPAHTSILSYMEELPDRTILVDSLSKRYSICGARLGVIVSKNDALMKGIMKIAQSRLSGGFIDQTVGAALVEVPDTYIQQVIAEYENRRDVLYKGLTRISGVTMTKPEGAFYSMVGLPVPHAEKFCIYLLEHYRSSNNETVMLAPGAGFYLTPGKGENEVRIAYVLNTSDITRSIEILDSALHTYKKLI